VVSKTNNSKRAEKQDWEEEGGKKNWKRGL